MPQFTEDDIGKTVVNPVDEPVGIVEDVVDGVPYVDPDPSLTDRIEAALGWSDEPDIDEYPLEDEHIESVTDDEVILRQDLHIDRSGSA